MERGLGQPQGLLFFRSIRHLSKTFEQKGNSVEALRDISLDIEEGDIYGIIGMSGAGKSTLVRCLNYLERPTSGEVIIGGRDLGTLTEKDFPAFQPSHAKECAGQCMFPDADCEEKEG